MNLRHLVLAVLPVLVAPPVGAVNRTELEVVSVKAFAPGEDTPRAGRPLVVEVMVRNNGPDVFDGTGPGRRMGGSGSYTSGSTLAAALDLVTGSCSDSVANETDAYLVPDATIVLPITLPSPVPVGCGDSVTVTGRVWVGDGNADSISSNNWKTQKFALAEQQVPATDWHGLAVVTLLMAGVGAWYLHRRGRREGPGEAVAS